jgi:hypothetical protein
MTNAQRKFRIPAPLAALLSTLFVAAPTVAPIGLRPAELTPTERTIDHQVPDQQSPHRMPTPPPSAQGDSDKTDVPKPDQLAQKKLQLAQNEKEFREGVERLYQLSGELRDEVQKTPTTAVLSVRMYKKTEEIEKLAKHLKAKAKGG